MTRGRAAKTAINAAVLVKFLDAHSEYRVDGNPRRRRHYINGVCLDQNIDARMIRRWRTRTQGITPASAQRMLARVGLDLQDFARWSFLNDEEYLLRGTVEQLRR